MALGISVAQRPATPPQVVISVSSVPAVLEEVELYRVHPDGSRWRVLTSSKAVLAGAGVWTDYHMPFNRPLRYQAVAGDQVSPLSSAIEVVSEHVWLIHPSDPALSLSVRLARGTAAEVVEEDRSEQIDVLGRAEPIDRTLNVRGAASGDLVLRTYSDAERAAVRALFRAGGVVLLSTPWSDNDLGWRWIRPGRTAVRMYDGAARGYARRYVDVPWRTVAAPDVDVRSQWTYNLVKQTFGSYSAMKAAFPTYKALKLNARST